VGESINSGFSTRVNGTGPRHRLARIMSFRASAPVIRLLGIILLLGISTLLAGYQASGAGTGPSPRVEFTEPAFWQRWWIPFVCVIAVALAIFGFYRLRLHQDTRELHVRFEERLAERTRVAQELHDTLLQGVLGASMQLHVAVDQLPEDSPARPALNHVLQLIAQVVDEGRNTLRGLGGTEIELRVPSGIAFESYPSTTASRWFRGLYRRKQNAPSQRPRSEVINEHTQRDSGFQR